MHIGAQKNMKYKIAIDSKSNTIGILIAILVGLLVLLGGILLGCLQDFIWIAGCLLLVSFYGWYLWLINNIEAYVKNKEEVIVSAISEKGGEIKIKIIKTNEKDEQR